VKWLLDVLKGVYSEALASPQGNREVANAKLRNVVKKVFRYPESVMQGCAVASRIVRGLMEMEAREIYVVKKLNSETLEKITSRYPCSSKRVDTLLFELTGPHL